MVKLVDYAEAKRLIDEVTAVEDKLLANERELYRSLVVKFAEPVPVAFDDLACLELLLRNVKIRAGYDIDPRRDPPRIIEPGRTRGKPPQG